MSILVVGADEIRSIKEILMNLGANNIEHWNARDENRVNKRKIPINTRCVVMLTSFLNHNTMKTIKTKAKKQNIPIVCAKRSANCVHCQYCKIFGLNEKSYLS